MTALILIATLLLSPIYYVFPLEWQLELNPNFLRSGYAESIFLWVSFVPAFIAPFLIYKFWHRLPFKRLLTHSAKFTWSRLFVALFVVIIGYSFICGIEYIIDPSEYADVVLHTDWNGFFILLAVTLIFLPIQSASEEILCRGYLNQGLSLITRNPWIAFVLTSAFFALLHLANPEAEGQIWPYMIDTFIFGMAMCWLSYEDQGLESAIGMHIGNNLFVFVLLGYADPSLPQSAILMAPEPVIEWKDTIKGAIYTIGLTFLIIHINRFMMRRRERLHANA
jgi:membrane protease YdiL (CAAX protease family)